MILLTEFERLKSSTYGMELLSQEVEGAAVVVQASMMELAAPMVAIVKLYI